MSYNVTVDADTNTCENADANADANANPNVNGNPNVNEYHVMTRLYHHQQ